MGMSTLSRAVKHPHLVGMSDSYVPGTFVSLDWDVSGPGVLDAIQVTTSYRTGRGRAGASSVEEDSDTALLSATNYRDRFKIMKEERRAKPKSVLDNGHEFKTQKSHVAYVSYGNLRSPGASWASYVGPLWPDLAAAAVPQSNYLFMPDADLGWYGPRAIAATTPTNPTAEVATALTELWREGIPLIPSSIVRREARLAGKKGTRKDPSAAAGAEYLNVEFGWKPLIRDIRRTADAVKRSEKILRQHRNNSGQSIRRQYTFPDEKTFVSYPPKSGTLAALSPSTGWRNAFKFGSVSGTMTESIETLRKVSFSGAYTYHVRNDESSLSGRIGEFEQKANLLLGTRVTPEVLWNVAPWSWLSDWHANIGENISNATALASDGLVLRYGYLMITSIVRHTLTLVGPRLLPDDTRASYSIEFVTVTKERVRASPFGFGSDPASFTGRQWAILASLGMTRGDKALRLND